MTSRPAAKLRKPKARYHHGDLREAALAAAAVEIDAHGHVAFTMERVAKRLGVTPAALYRHYTNRDDLLREVTWQIFQRYAETVDAAALAADSDDALAAISRAYVRFAVANPGWFRLQFSVAGIALSDRQATAQTKYADVMRRELGRLFFDDVSATRWFMALWAFVHGAASMAVEHLVPPLHTDEERVAHADDQITTFLEGLHAASRRHKHGAQS